MKSHDSRVVGSRRQGSERGGALSNLRSARAPGLAAHCRACCKARHLTALQSAIIHMHFKSETHLCYQCQATLRYRCDLKCETLISGRALSKAWCMHAFLDQVRKTQEGSQVPSQKSASDPTLGRAHGAPGVRRADDPYRRAAVELCTAGAAVALAATDAAIDREVEPPLALGHSDPAKAAVHRAACAARQRHLWLRRAELVTY